MSFVLLLSSDFFFAHPRFLSLSLNFCAYLSVYLFLISHAHASSFETTPLDSTCSNSQPSPFEQQPASKSFHRRMTNLQPLVKSIPDLRKGKRLLLRLQIGGRKRISSKVQHFARNKTLPTPSSVFLLLFTCLVYCRTSIFFSLFPFYNWYSMYLN